MSGQQNQPNRGWNRGPPSPIYYKPPSPWAPSPPPIISGPRPQFNNQNHNNNIAPNASYNPPKSPVGISGRSTPMSPMFGSSGLRGTRGPQLPYPRPRWPGSPPPIVQIQQAPTPLQSRVSPSPITVGVNGPKPYRAPPTYSPVHMYSNASPVFGTPPEYLYSGPLPQFEVTPRYEYVGVPLEPPQPTSYIIYDDDEDHGPTTAEIIANQSQDYVDEKLAEYQLTIAQLQGEFYHLIFYLFFYRKLKKKSQK